MHIQLRHNLVREKYMWLWAKYVENINDQKHCTKCLRGRYSKKFSGHNERLAEIDVIFDEFDSRPWKAIYLCGVIKKGYPKSNYPHNLHAALYPKDGATDTFEFEDIKMEVSNALFMPIPEEGELPDKYKAFPSEYTTCRIFRWAVLEGEKAVAEL